MSDFLDIDTTGAGDLRAMIDSARAMKAARTARPRGAADDVRALDGRMAALIFEKPSTRTRVSFDVAVRQMGGETMVLSAGEMQLGHGEAIADTARVLSRYVDAIVLRTFAEATLAELAAHATVPVVNGLTDRSHPCQIMADVLTFEEHRGPIGGAKVVWVGDGNNVCASFVHAAGRFGFDLIFTGPETLEPPEALMQSARDRGVRAEVVRDPAAAVAGADLVVTDTWLSMHDAPETRATRHAMLAPYQVTEALMEAAAPQGLFMHCLPAHRGEEATDSVLDGPRAVIFDEAENRLHVQKAILRWCLDV